MRRMLRMLKWLGLGLSTILFVGTGVLWVRSVGHREVWTIVRFEARPDWTAPDLAGRGFERWWFAEANHGRLWLGSGASVPRPPIARGTRYRRAPFPADEANEQFDSTFQSGERTWHNGTVRGWRFAGAGFRHIRDYVDPEIGQPSHETFDLAIPFWLLVVVFGLWPLLFTARRVLRRRQHGAGLCPSCGYDLRATPERCPECGRVVADQRGYPIDSVHSTDVSDTHPSQDGFTIGERYVTLTPLNLWKPGEDLHLGRGGADAALPPDVGVGVVAPGTPITIVATRRINTITTGYDYWAVGCIDDGEFKGKRCRMDLQLVNNGAPDLTLLKRVEK